MTSLTLEDMTKAELIKAIKQMFARQPTPKQLGWIRWESMCEKSQAMMEESVKEQERYAGSKLPSDVARWTEASDRFTKAMKLYQQADTFWEGLTN